MSDVIAVLAFGEAGAPLAGDLVAALASGEGAACVAATLRAYGADIEVLDGPAGLAGLAGHAAKLYRVLVGQIG